MNERFLINTLQDKLSKKIENISSITGGDINDVYKITTSQNTYVLKVNKKDLFPEMFQKEKLGLELLSKSGVKAPEVIHTFSDEKHQYLLLEYLQGGSVTPNFWKYFANDLIKIHKITNNYFGLDHDNYIGSLHQNNNEKSTWESFFIENRMNPLVKQAFDLNRLNKRHLNHLENLYSRLNELLPTEKPSLIHGDLWGGNLMKGKDQAPVFIDPAVYFGLREMDIAMTQLFGGFDNNYLTHYNEIFPLEKGWEKRIEIHNLYPNLVHLILFGGGYLSGIESVIRKF